MEVKRFFSKPWGDMVMENTWDGWKNYISILLSLFCKTFLFSFRSVVFPWETLCSCFSHLILFPSQNFVSECKVSWQSNNFARERKSIKVQFFFQFNFFPLIMSLKGLHSRFCFGRSVQNLKFERQIVQNIFLNCCQTYGNNKEIKEIYWK